MVAGEAALEPRLKQAKESLENAKDLLVQDAAVQFVMNGVYYSFLYPVFGLLEARGMSSATHQEAIALFEREYVASGAVERRFLDAIRAAFEIRPACDCEGKRKATAADIERLLPLAEDFLVCVERLSLSAGTVQ